ncbi:V-type ATP synthase subunit C [Halobacteriales archaeon SW_7_68_16]|nr:MAG: V-type ATP synthase subunit C [Halobacteriales archaeon SW_7_68_16]
MNATGTSNPEYVNARVRSRRAALFGEDEYRKLIRMGTGEIARFMEENGYETEINALAARHDGVDLIEYALNHNMAANFEDVLRWADGRVYEDVARYLRKFDAWNVKTVLRGIYADTDREVVEADLIRAGEFDEATLSALVDAGSIDAVVETLDGTGFGAPLREAMGDYETTGALVPLENAVDRAFYERLIEDASARGEAGETYVEFLQAEIDFRNLRNALRIARSGADIDPEDYFIVGGREFDADELRRLTATREELVARIRESEYGEELDDALDEFETADSLIGFERALEGALLSYFDAMTKVYPMSICPVLAYVLGKEREVDNVRAIARGVEAGLSDDEIERELVL